VADPDPHPWVQTGGQGVRPAYEISCQVLKVVPSTFRKHRLEARDGNHFCRFILDDKALYINPLCKSTSNYLPLLLPLGAGHHAPPEAAARNVTASMRLPSGSRTNAA